MDLNEYEPGTAFTGVIGRTPEESSPAWPRPNRAKEGAPNVVFVVLDDTGFAQLGCYGSPIATPNRRSTPSEFAIAPPSSASYPHFLTTTRTRVQREGRPPWASSP